jgi:hypothetical protein
MLRKVPWRESVISEIRSKVRRFSEGHEEYLNGLPAAQLAAFWRQMEPKTYLEARGFLCGTFGEHLARTATTPGEVYVTWP